MTNEKIVSEEELHWLISDEHGQKLEKHSRGYCFWFLIISLLLNSLQLSLQTFHRAPFWSNDQKLAPVEIFKTSKSPYSGLARDTSVTYSHHTDYVSKNATLANKLWSDLESIMVVAVSEDWAQEKNLEHSWRFPWDPEKRIYFMKVGHQLHCLKSLREALRQLYETGNVQLSRWHLEHCIDTLRQDVMCYADDTPMPTVELINGAGEGQTLQCKSWDKFQEWLHAPERHACHKHINQFTGVNHSIERYAYCPEDSEYYPIMKEYFDIHGHLDEIVDE